MYTRIVPAATPCGVDRAMSPPFRGYRVRCQSSRACLTLPLPHGPSAPRPLHHLLPVWVRLHHVCARGESVPPLADQSRRDVRWVSSCRRLSVLPRPGDRPLPADQSLRGAHLSRLVDGAFLPAHRPRLPAFAARLLYLAAGLSSCRCLALAQPMGCPQPAAELAPNAWLELHAAISIVAYGAFALAGVAGVMYLAQERQLKTHHLHSIFYHLPPIRDLAVANSRLVYTGFALLTVGLFAGFAMGNLQCAPRQDRVVERRLAALRPFSPVRTCCAGSARGALAWLSVAAFTVVLADAVGAHLHRAAAAALTHGNPLPRPQPPHRSGGVAREICHPDGQLAQAAADLARAPGVARP